MGDGPAEDADRPTCRVPLRDVGRAFPEVSSPYDDVMGLIRSEDDRSRRTAPEEVSS